MGNYIIEDETKNYSVPYVKRKYNNGINADIIDKLTETNYDMTEFYQYVKEYDIKLLTY